MFELTYSSVRANWFVGTSSIEVFIHGRSIGQMKTVGHGAIAETTIGTFSFRPDGLDPAERSVWRRRFGHSASVLDLRTNRTVATFGVTPFAKRLMLGEARYRWALSFLMNRAHWKVNGRAVATVQGQGWRRRQGTVTVDASVAAEDASVLALTGLYLFLTGRPG